MKIPFSDHSDVATITQNFHNRGYHILAESLSKMEISNIIGSLKAQSVRRTPLDESNQTQWWDEVSCPANSIAAKLIYRESVSGLIAAKWGKPRFCAYWANVYRTGECIPRHKDTEGDLQIITALVTPPAANGGILIIHHNGTHRLRLKPGEQLLFKASATFHETTPLISNAEQPDPVRCVGVCRIFLNT